MTVAPAPPHRPTGWKLAVALLAAVAAMALGAQADVPMHPVPMSLQSLKSGVLAAITVALSRRRTP